MVRTTPIPSSAASALDGAPSEDLLNTLDPAEDWRVLHPDEVPLYLAFRLKGEGVSPT